MSIYLVHKYCPLKSCPLNVHKKFSLQPFYFVLVHVVLILIGFDIHDDFKISEKRARFSGVKKLLGNLLFGENKSFLMESKTSDRILLLIGYQFLGIWYFFEGHDFRIPVHIHCQFLKNVVECLIWYKWDSMRLSDNAMPPAADSGH